MIPDSLSSLIAQALRHLDDAPDGDLPLGYREAIWAELGQRQSNTGRRRRARLSLTAARAVRHFWLDQRPTDDFFDRAIRTAESLLVREATAEVMKTADAFWNETGGFRDNDAATAAASAAVKAVLVAAYDETFDAADLDVTRPEDPNVAYGDASYFAARAISGGHFLRPETRREERRQFWRWWLTEAVPAAYESESTDS